MTTRHIPVMVDEVGRYLCGDNEERLFAIDATLGDGGHAEYLLTRCLGMRLLGVDRDQEMIDRARYRLAPFADRVEYHCRWFDDFFQNYRDSRAPDIVLFDLGIATTHLASSCRGFSFRLDEPLDMRLDVNAPLSAMTLIDRLREEEIANIIFTYGDERYSRRIARAIVGHRKQGPITTASQLSEIIYRAVPVSYRRRYLHPATRSFQALRIAVNDELERLRRALPDALRILAIGGKIAVISFHSHEDRIVKCQFRDLSRSGQDQSTPAVRLITKKPLFCREEERRVNPAARSARLRVAQKLRELAPDEGVISA